MLEYAHRMQQIKSSTIRLVTWNCAGKFREKFELISKLNADIYIIQECENPCTCNHEAYRRFSANHLWMGDIQYKGLGVFARQNISMTPLLWESYCLRNFLPIKINNEWNLLAVWASKPYIEEYYVYHSIHKDKFDANTIVIGDFNSNQKWDNKHGKRSHSAVVQMMNEAKLVSSWHHQHHVAHGQENEPTFYLYRNKERPYHIDYAFASPERILACHISHDEIFSCSDHRPLIVDIKR